jgi:Ca-activated chloride channel family protein
MPSRLLLVLACLLVLCCAINSTSAAPAADSTSGTLAILGKSGGFCPLRHTDVQAGISGFVARVVVTQSFENPSSSAIEAVYTFPLPHDAAVNEMTIRIGDRTIRGVIKEREEAAKIYEQAIKNGQTAALLNQERPNIFTQKVGNIPPGANVEVAISYVEMLKYEDGAYEFAFPMVVGPRYIPGTKAIGQTGGGFSADTDRVPDASRITPPISPTRAGHDISLALALDAGVPIQDLASSTHDVDIQRTGPTAAVVKLKDDDAIPNKDFILRYTVAGSEIAEGLLTHTRGVSDGYFSLIIQPPARFPESDVTPKEIVFVLDSSGSMDGFPEAKAKQFIDLALNGLYAGDTFNLIKFSGDTAVLFPKPVYPSAENLKTAHAFLKKDWGHGGTEMMKAINAALDPSDAQDHIRIVVFLTDGYIGNDFEILSEIKKHANARVFAFGVGSSVNRYLIEGMGRVGRGASEIISEQENKDEADAAAHRLYERLRSPLLTDISLDFGSLPVTDVYPQQISDLFAGRPVIVTGRFTGTAKGTVRLTGKRAGDPYVRDIPVVFPVTDAANVVLPGLWARNKIEHLMTQDLLGLQQQQMKPELQKEITQLGLNYSLLTQFTSFVAVEELVSNVDGTPTTIQVPVELPQGVRFEADWKQATAQPMMVNTTQVVSVGGAMETVEVSTAQETIDTTSSSVTHTYDPETVYGKAPVTGGPIFTRRAKNAPKTEVQGPPPPTPPAPGGSGGTQAVTLAGDVSGVKDRELTSKLQPQLLAAYECWQKHAISSDAQSACKLPQGKVSVEIIVSGPNATAKLVSVGFEPEAFQRARTRLRGRIAIDKLKTVAAMSEVQYITLATIQN